VEREATVIAVQQSIASLLAAEGISLVDLRWGRRGKRWVLTLVIDKEGGVTLDDCAHISRQVGGRLEVDNVIDHAYTLEVSSPGLDRPLRTIADYHRFQGHLVKIITLTPVQGRSTIVGRLQGVEGSHVLVEAPRLGAVSIPLAHIKQARLEVEF
jgi:ribosome maturation factor RimP